MMIDVKKLNIGDKVRAVEVSHAELELNEIYTISCIIIGESERTDRVRLVETHNDKYYISRFVFDLKETRKNKLLNLSNISDND